MIHTNKLSFKPSLINLNSIQSSSSGSSSVDDGSEKWDDSSSSSSSSSEDDIPEGGTELKGRARWLKKVVIVKEKNKKTKGPKKDPKESTTEKDFEEKKDEEVEEEMSAAVLNRKCMDLVSSRGRRGTDSKVVLQKLERLSQMAEKFGPRIEVPILMHVITAQFDLIRTLDDYMETPAWKACMEKLNRIAGFLEDEDDDSKKYQLCPLSNEDDDTMIGNVLAKKKDVKMKDAAGVGEMGALEAVSADTKLINPHTGETETEDERAERLRVEKEESMTDEEKRKIPVIGE